MTDLDLIKNSTYYVKDFIKAIEAKNTIILAETFFITKFIRHYILENLLIDQNIFMINWFNKNTDISALLAKLQNLINTLIINRAFDSIDWLIDQKYFNQSDIDNVLFANAFANLVYNNKSLNNPCKLIDKAISDYKVDSETFRSIIKDLLKTPQLSNMCLQIFRANKRDDLVQIFFEIDKKYDNFQNEQPNIFSLMNFCNPRSIKPEEYVEYLDNNSVKDSLTDFISDHITSIYMATIPYDRTDILEYCENVSNTTNLIFISDFMDDFIKIAVSEGSVNFLNKFNQCYQIDKSYFDCCHFDALIWALRSNILVDVSHQIDYYK